MFVCNCNGINEKSVRNAVSNGASDWRAVHAYYGCSPSCGKCECEMKIAIEEERIKMESRQNNDNIYTIIMISTYAHQLHQAKAFVKAFVKDCLDRYNDK